MSKRKDYDILYYDGRSVFRLRVTGTVIESAGHEFGIHKAGSTAYSITLLEFGVMVGMTRTVKDAKAFIEEHAQQIIDRLDANQDAVREMKATFERAGLRDGD